MRQVLAVAVERAAMQKYALLALVLSLSLTACGGTPTVEEQEETTAPAEVSVEEPAEEVEEAPGPEEDHSENILSNYGHISFVNTDDNRFGFYGVGSGIEEVMNADNIPDESLEGYCAVLPPDGEEHISHGIVFRTKGGTEITEELKLGILNNLLGRDTHMEITLDDGSTLFITYEQNSGYYNMITLDEADGTLWVSVVSTTDLDELFPCFILEDEISFAEMFQANAITSTKRVGSEEFGFVDIPENWVEFNDISNPDAFQYSSPNGQNIITLDAYKAEDFGITGDDVEDFALTVAYSMIGRYEDSEDDSLVEGYESYTDEIGGMNAYLIITHWADNTDMYTYIIDNKDTAYCISIEGDPETVFELVASVRENYSLSE